MKKVLVIDDDLDLLESVHSTLLENGFASEVISQWETIYGRVRTFKPDLILLDVQLFGMDGRIICENLKKTGDTKQIPVIMISSYPLSPELVKKYGADDFVAKPFKLDELIVKINLIISGRENLQ